MFLFIRLQIYPFIYLFVYKFTHLFIRLQIYPFIYLFTF